MGAQERKVTGRGREMRKRCAGCGGRGGRGGMRRVWGVGDGKGEGGAVVEGFERCDGG